MTHLKQSRRTTIGFTGLNGGKPAMHFNTDEFCSDRPYPTPNNQLDGEASNQSSQALKASQNLLEAAFHPNKSARELQLVTEGTLLGITNEIKNNPDKALKDAATSVAAGAAFGIGVGMIAAEAPLVAAACVGGATVIGAHWLWTKIDPFNQVNIGRNRELQTAMDSLWSMNSQYTYQTSLDQFQNAIGKDGLEVATGLLSGVGAASATKCAPYALSYLKQSPLKARIEFNVLDKNWIKQADGSKVLKSSPFEPLQTKAYPDGRRVVEELDTGVTTTTHRTGIRVSEYPNGNKLTKTPEKTELEFANGEKWIERDGAREIHKPDGTIRIQTLIEDETIKPDKMIYRKNHARADMTSIDRDGNLVNYRSDTSILKYNLHNQSQKTIEYIDGRKTTWDANSATFKTREGTTKIVGQPSKEMWSSPKRSD